MLFADIGWPELLLILSVALLIFGPQRMVELARTAGKALREFRSITDEISGSFTDILKEEPSTPPPSPTAVDETAMGNVPTEAPVGPLDLAGPLTIPPPVTIPPDEYDPADQSMPPFPEEPETGDELAPETADLPASTEPIDPTPEE